MSDLSTLENLLKRIIQPIITDALQSAVDQIRSEYSPQEEEEFITAEQAADYLHLSVHTLYGMTSNREIPFHKSGKKLLFIKSDLRDWVTDRKIKSKDEIGQKAIEKMRSKRRN